MMKHLLKIIIFLTVVTSLFFCSKNEVLVSRNTTCEEDQLTIENKLQEIIKLSESIPCTDASSWKFVSYGAKACGGPVGYIAYSTKLNVQNFLTKVNDLTKFQNEVNKKCNLVSDCTVPIEPKGIRSENNRPVFYY